MPPRDHDDRKSNQQQYGTVHGGVLVAFADTIAGAAWPPWPDASPRAARVNFLRPAAGPHLFCRATPCRWAAGSAWSLWAAQPTGTLITTALFTFAVVKRMDPILLPPKHQVSH